MQTEVVFRRVVLCITRILYTYFVNIFANAIYIAVLTYCSQRDNGYERHHMNAQLTYIQRHQLKPIPII